MTRVIVALLLVMSACAGSQQLDRRIVGGSPTLTTIDEVPVHGHHVDVELRNGNDVEGELLAAHEDELFVLGDGDALFEFQAEEIEEISIQLHDTREVMLGVWTGIGTVSTLSHGVFLIVSAPLWATVGGTLTAVEAGTGDEEVGPSVMPALAQFARYPQGMPSRRTSRSTSTVGGEGPSAPASVPPGYGEQPPQAEEVEAVDEADAEPEPDAVPDPEDPEDTVPDPEDTVPVPGP